MVGVASDVATQNGALLGVASQIADFLTRSAIRSANGSYWLRHEPVAGTRRRTLVPIDFGLEYGQLGIALFLALLASTTRSKRWRRESRAALIPVIGALEYAGPGPHFAERFGVDALATTLAGIAIIGFLLDDKDLPGAVEQTVEQGTMHVSHLHHPVRTLMEVIRTTLHVSIGFAARPFPSIDGRTTRIRLDNLYANPHPESSILDGGLAGSLSSMLEAAAVRRLESDPEDILAAATEITRRFRAGRLGGYLSDPSLLACSPSLLDGLSGIGAVLVLAAHFPEMHGHWRKP